MMQSIMQAGGIKQQSITIISHLPPYHHYTPLPLSLPPAYHTSTLNNPLTRIKLLNNVQ